MKRVVRAESFPVGARVTLEQLEHNPYPVLAELRSTEPVSWVPALGAWFITRRDLALDAMRDAERFTVDDPRFTTGAVLGPSMLSLDGSEHDRHRSPFAPAFRPGILRQQFDGYLHGEVARLIGNLVGPGPSSGPSNTTTGSAELRTQLAGPLAVNVITRFLGLDGVTAGEILAWYRSIARAITDLTLGNEVATSDGEAVTEVRRRVETTLSTASDDSLLKSIERSGALRPDELGSAALVLMFGAIETAEGMTANAFWHLLSDHARWEVVRGDRRLLANAIEESLRLEPAAAVIDRYTTSDVTLAGTTIPAGELVTISLLGANHDPVLFDDPQNYDLHRHNARQHLTFVQGPHGCLGLHLARMETAAAIDGFLDALPDVVLNVAASSPPSGLIFRKPAAVHVEW